MVQQYIVIISGNIGTAIYCKNIYGSKRNIFRNVPGLTSICGLLLMVKNMHWKYCNIHYQWYQWDLHDKLQFYLFHYYIHLIVDVNTAK